MMESLVDFEQNPALLQLEQLPPSQMPCGIESDSGRTKHLKERKL